MAKAPPQFNRLERHRKPSRQFGILRALLPFLRPYRALIIWGMLVLVATTLVSLALPYVAREVVDQFNSDRDMALTGYFVLALFGAAALAAGSALRTYLISILGEKIVVDLRNAIFHKVIGLSPSFFERTRTGEILSRITADTAQIQAIVGSSGATALRNGLILGGGSALLLATAPKLAVFVLMFIPFSFVPIYFLGRKLRQISRDFQDWIAASSGVAAESLSAVQAVQSFSHEDSTRDQFQVCTANAFNAADTRIKIQSGLTFAAMFLGTAGSIVVFWLGVQDVQAGLMTLGTLVQFMIYAAMVASSVTGFAQLWGALQRAAGATDRLIELLQTQDSVTDPLRALPLPRPVAGRIAFEDVHFTYPMRPETAALKGVRFEVEPGETVALVGPSGAGKTTIIQLIQRFYDPASGRVTLDGVDLSDMTRSEFRKAIALVPQDPAIFAASAKDNILFGRPDASMAEVEAAARAAAAHDFIAAFPQGYDSQLGERGIMLSGGQKQRIAIARAILRNGQVLLLDEATSALDAESEASVQQAVDRLSRDRTTVIIAHRLATVKKADRIIVMDEGHIVAMGTHAELLAAGGLYARLAKLQFIG